MKPSKLRELSDDELVQRERDLVEQLFRLRFQHATGQLDSPITIRSIRRDVARIKTILRERQVSQEGNIPSPERVNKEESLPK